jgi:hypothetical protein
MYAKSGAFKRIMCNILEKLTTVIPPTQKKLRVLGGYVTVTDGDLQVPYICHYQHVVK